MVVLILFCQAAVPAVSQLVSQLVSLCAISAHFSFLLVDQNTKHEECHTERMFGLPGTVDCDNCELNVAMMGG